MNTLKLNNLLHLTADGRVTLCGKRTGRMVEYTHTNVLKAEWDKYKSKKCNDCERACGHESSNDR